MCPFHEKEKQETGKTFLVKSPTSIVLLIARNDPNPPSKMEVSGIFSDFPEGYGQYVNIANNLSSQFTKPGIGLRSRDIFEPMLRNPNKIGHNPLVSCIPYDYIWEWPPSHEYLLSLLLDLHQKHALSTKCNIDEAFAENLKRGESWEIREITVAILPLYPLHKANNNSIQRTR
jgi:hypothetical protein